MKKSKKTNGRQQQPAPAKQSSAPRREPTLDEIRDRAYRLFLQRGGAPGHAIDDWLTAEKELRGSRS